jgi:hypothetical protein
MRSSIYSLIHDSNNDSTISYSPPDNALLLPKVDRFVDEDDCLPLLIGRVDDDNGDDGLLSTAAADCNGDDCYVLPSAAAPFGTISKAFSRTFVESNYGTFATALLQVIFGTFLGTFNITFF